MFEGECVVATYSAHKNAEDAVKGLHLSGFDITQLSIIYDGCRIEERIVGFYSEDQRLRSWGKSGALWGSILGVLSGAALFYAPVTAELVFQWSAVVLAGSLLFGGLSVAGALVYGKLLTVDRPLNYEFAEQGEERFTLAAHDENLATKAREIILRSDSLADRMQQSDATEPAAVVGAPSDAARSVLEGRRVCLKRRKSSVGVGV